MNNSLTETEGYTAEELLTYKKELQKYYLACLWMEGSKLLLFTLIFGILHLIPEYLSALFMLAALRKNGGGIHCKSYLGCFAVSLFVLTAGIMLPRYITLSLGIALPLLFSSSILSFYLVPIVSESRPTPAPEQKKRSKRRTLAIILLYSLVICMDCQNPYLQTGIWIIYLHILQLCVAKIMEGGMKNAAFTRLHLHTGE